MSGDVGCWCCVPVRENGMRVCCVVLSVPCVESVMMSAMICPLWSSKVENHISECAFMSAVMMVYGICVRCLMMFVMSVICCVSAMELSVVLGGRYTLAMLMCFVGVMCILVSCASVYMDVSVFGMVSSVNVMFCLTYVSRPPPVLCCLSVRIGV